VMTTGARSAPYKTALPGGSWTASTAWPST
jgi:hypothetical protein